MTKLFRPAYFLVGFILGLLFCSLVGYYVSTKARFHHFSRFFMEISPQTLYYPTASELLQTARHEVSKDKILVLVGGSSIFRGVGQDPGDAWTTELQALLGDKYKVLNYASDGASFSSYGGVAFRMLRQEYPKIIFVAAAYQFNSEGFMDGLPPYDYLFWDAYYKKLFKPYKKEAELIEQLRKEEMTTKDGVEKHFMAYLDSLFYFRNLWNWVGYQLLFTMYNENNLRTPFQPRRKYHEALFDPKYKKVLYAANHDAAHVKQYKDLIRLITTGIIDDITHTPLKIKKSVLSSCIQGYDNVFQPIDRSKILMVQTTYNTRIIGSMPNNIQKGYWVITKISHEAIASLGYPVLDIGQDFVDDDFMDIDHFWPSGGKKLAVQVAKEVKHIAKSNHYC